MGPKGNKALARIVQDICERLALPPVLQWEITDNLPELPKAGVVREHREKGRYLDTREVLFQSWETCVQHGWTKAVVIAHPDHLWRCVRAAEKLGFEVVGIPDTSDVPYDPPWNRKRFMLREIFYARPLYLFRGYI